MAKRHTPSNGAGYPVNDWPDSTQQPIASNYELKQQHDAANRSGPAGASLQYNSSDFFSRDPYVQCMSPQMRQQYIQLQQQVFKLQQDVYYEQHRLLPHGHASPSPTQQDPAPCTDEMQCVRTEPGYEMSDIHMKDSSDNSSTDGAKYAEAVKQPPAPVTMAGQPPPPAAGGPAPAYSTAKTFHEGHGHSVASNGPNGAYGQGVAGNGPNGGAPIPKERHCTSPAIHRCCNTSCATGQYSAQGPPHSKRKSGGLGIMKTIGSFLGIAGDIDEDESSIAEKFHDKIAALKKDYADLEKRYTVAEKNACAWQKEFKMKDDELRQAKKGKQSDDTQIAHLHAKLQDITDSNARAANARNSEVAHLRAKNTEYQATVDRLTAQISSLEQSNSKSVGGTGAHKDSHAIPPNLVKSAFVVNEAALTFTKTFTTFLKERKVFDHHVALQNVPAGADRYRKYAIEAYVCSRLFAGFENDSYVDSLDSLQSSPYLPGPYEETDFFLQNQDLESRHQRYLEEYDELRELGLQGIMEKFKTNQAESIASFSRFCCRKLVNIVGVDGLNKEFPQNGDYSNNSLLHQLASNPKYCDKFLKPFVNLALVTFLLHRLAFQFNPPARIFRCARGTSFDQTYMESAVPIDDDDSDVEVAVGLVLVPGFQVGATVIKCTVYLVPRSVPPASSRPS